MTILHKIVQHKRKELELSKQQTPLSALEKREIFSRKTCSLRDAVLDPEKTAIIAEFKRKSPSRGIINSQVTLEEVTTGYFRSGASALSVLTDAEFFGGSMEDLRRARELNPIPILRKDFIVDEYQVVESKAIGADAILLIAAILDRETLKSLAMLARSLGMQVLLEVHNEKELDHINEFVDLIGVNNRDLKTFRVDVACSLRLIEKIPDSFVRISESGISSPLILKKLKGAGFQGFLIGETFMHAADPVSAFSGFVKLIIE